MTTAPARILVADDDYAIRDLVSAKLSQAGFAVQVAEDGTAALAAIQDDPPALAVLDIMMPGLSGIDVLSKIREDDRTRRVRVILLTTFSRAADIEAGFATGADDYIIKPFSPRDLLRRVHAVLEYSHF